VSNQTYPFWSTEHLYTRGPASGLGQKFLYFLHTDDAISLLHQYGFQSINDVSNSVVRNHS
jgi:ABC-type phosphate transport system substrate-binding protein